MKLAIGLGISLVMSLGVILGLLFTQPASAGPSYLPRTFVIGPGSTETFFYIQDKSRPPTKLWICGFIHNFTKAEYGGYHPDLECWPY